MLLDFFCRRMPILRVIFHCLQKMKKLYVALLCWHSLLFPENAAMGFVIILVDVPLFPLLHMCWPYDPEIRKGRENQSPSPAMRKPVWETNWSPSFFVSFLDIKHKKEKFWILWKLPFVFFVNSLKLRIRPIRKTKGVPVLFCSCYLFVQLNHFT